MTTSSAARFVEHLHLLRLVARQASLGLRARIAHPVNGLSQWFARPPDRLLIAPQDIRTGDPTIAAEIYAGYFVFGGKIVNSHGRSPFKLPPPSPEWARALHGFGWLRHLHAADTALARANARSLVKEFIADLGHPAGHPAWRTEVVARRTLSWLSQSPMLLEGAAYPDYRGFLSALARGYWRLRRDLKDERSGSAQLSAAIAMTAYALCVQGGAPLLKHAVAALDGQLAKQILPDGVTIDRNPQRLVDLLFDLLPLRHAFMARGLTPPSELLNAIDRMTPALRLFRHGDGSLALFNGMGITAPDRVAAALSCEDVQGRPIFNARHAGYQRIQAAESLVIFDAGPPPPPGLSHTAHAGALSFEFSVGAERIVVNCGNPGRQRPDLCMVARQTAAHSTLSLENQSSSRFSGDTFARHWFHDEILSGPTLVPVTRTEDVGGTIVEATHDGYAARFKLIHRRQLVLAADGTLLSGEDRLISSDGSEPGDVHYAIRFHIHPSISLTSLWKGKGVLLRTARGVSLVFQAGGLPVDIEKSIFFAAPEGVRACEQIVVHGVASDIGEIGWTFSLVSSDEEDARRRS